MSIWGNGNGLRQEKDDDTFQTLQLHLARMHARLHLFLSGG